MVYKNRTQDMSKKDCFSHKSVCAVGPVTTFSELSPKDNLSLVGALHGS